MSTAIDTHNSKTSARPLSILLVEDNPGDVRLTHEALKECGVNSTMNAVVDGSEAIKYLYNEGPYVDSPRPDLILLDLNLPKKDGREVIACIKKDEKLMTIPIVVLTTSNAEGDILKVYDLGANCYMAKPIDFNRFIDVMSSIGDYWLKWVRLPS